MTKLMNNEIEEFEPEEEKDIDLDFVETPGVNAQKIDARKEVKNFPTWVSTHFHSGTVTADSTEVVDCWFQPKAVHAVVSSADIKAQWLWHISSSWTITQRNIYNEWATQSYVNESYVAGDTSSHNIEITSVSSTGITFEVTTSISMTFYLVILW